MPIESSYDSCLCTYCRSYYFNVAILTPIRAFEQVQIGKQKGPLPSPRLPFKSHRQHRTPSIQSLETARDNTMGHMETYEVQCPLEKDLELGPRGIPMQSPYLRVCM